MTETVCPFCGSEDPGPYLRRKDGLTVYHCRSCDLRHVAMKELEALYRSLPALYEKEYYHSGDSIGYSDYEAVSLASFLWQPAFVQLIKDIKGKIVLDIGCATGRLLGLMKEQGAARVEGLEFSAYAADKARAGGFVVHQGDISALPPGARFDIITAFDVIEHIPDLSAFMARVCELLTPEGVFVFLTPDAGSAEALIQKEGWYGYNSSLEHIYYFSVPSLRAVLVKAFGHDPVIYQANTAEGQGILGFIRKEPSPDDATLQGLFLSNFGPEFINAGNVEPVCTLLQRMGDQRYIAYLERYRPLPERGTGTPGPSSAPDAGKVVIRRYRDGDEQGIVKLFKEVFGREMPLDEWNWKYKGQGGTKIGSVVIEDPQYGIVGHYGCIYLRMVRDGRAMTGASSCDVMIHPKFRSFIRLKKLHTFFIAELIGEDVPMIFGFPTEETLMIPADKLGMYERIEVVHEAVKDVRLHNGLVRFACRLAPLEFDDERIDRLWKKASGQFGLTTIKDRAYLGWRYRDNRLFSYELWGLQKRWSRELLAIAVIKKEHSERMFIMDTLFLEGRLPELMQKVENYAAVSGKKKLSLWASSQIRETLAGEGFTLALTGTTLPRSTHPLSLKKDEILKKFFYAAGDTDYL
ncbi:MAG: GNAT family N-acetyltransferase [Nitrospirae bacterium]|nr:MAG: GNAT family N-acetyltransferase [Nitrospirota bacterium]